MSNNELTANIVIAMIDNNKLDSVEDVSNAYKEIYNAINNTLNSIG